MQATLQTIHDLQARYRNIRLQDKSQAYNTELMQCLELGYGLDIAEATCLGALERKESRGAHKRLEEGLQQRDDVNYLKHSQVFFNADGPAELRWQDVDTHLSAPAERAYGDAGKGVKQ
ncbi:MAG: hypothetical protein U5L98_02570 [Halomonas sp.]|nr:hypothetical protein [Halomonas sp.]